MKKLLLVLAFFLPFTAFADTQSDLQNQYVAALQQVIALLQQEVSQLEQQLVSLNQTVTTIVPETPSITLFGSVSVPPPPPANLFTGTTAIQTAPVVQSIAMPPDVTPPKLEVFEITTVGGATRVRLVSKEQLDIKATSVLQGELGDVVVDGARQPSGDYYYEVNITGISGGTEATVKDLAGNATTVFLQIQ